MTPVVTTTPEPLPSGRRGLDPEAVAESQRTRLLDAITMLCSEVGYQAVTIGAITSRARTAKRTFYAHFPDREACFIAAFDRVDQALFDSIIGAAAEHTDPYPRIRAGVGALLDYLAASPPAASMWVETAAAGGVALDRRNAALNRLADLYQALHRATPTSVAPPLEPLTSERALSVVGAIELPVSVTLRNRGVDALPGLADDLSHSVYTLVYGRPPEQG